MVMFLLSFVKGSKSAEGGPNPRRGVQILLRIWTGGSKSASRYGPGGPYPLADLDRGSNSRGGPNLLGHRQPGSVFKKLDTRQSEILTSFLEIACLIPLRT